MSNVESHVMQSLFGTVRWLRGELLHALLYGGLNVPIAR